MGLHESYKRRERGRKEVPVKFGKAQGRLDASTKRTAVEIERSGRYTWSAKKLLGSRRPSKILRVPRNQMAQARKAVQKVLDKSKAKEPRITVTSLNKKVRTVVRKHRG